MSGDNAVLNGTVSAVACLSPAGRYALGASHLTTRRAWLAAGAAPPEPAAVSAAVRPSLPLTDRRLQRGGGRGALAADRLISTRRQNAAPHRMRRRTCPACAELCPYSVRPLDGTNDRRKRHSGPRARDALLLPRDCGWNARRPTVASSGSLTSSCDSQTLYGAAGSSGDGR